MAQSKDYSIYQELDLSLVQIKRELPRVAQAANSRLAKLEKIHARDQWAYGRVKEFLRHKEVKRSLFERRKTIGCISPAGVGYDGCVFERTGNNVGGVQNR